MGTKLPVFISNTWAHVWIYRDAAGGRKLPQLQWLTPDLAFVSSLCYPAPAAARRGEPALGSSGPTQRSSRAEALQRLRHLRQSAPRPRRPPPRASSGAARQLDFAASAASPSWGGDGPGGLLLEVRQRLELLEGLLARAQAGGGAEGAAGVSPGAAAAAARLAGRLRALETVLMAQLGRTGSATMAAMAAAATEEGVQSGGELSPG